MAAGQHNIIIEKGATFSKTLIVKDSAGDVVDLTGATVAGKFRSDKQEDTNFAFVFTIDTPASGNISWTMSDTVTATLPAGHGFYDINVTYSDNTVQRILEGTANVKEWVGRTTS